MAEDITTQEVEQVDNTQQQLPEQPPKKLSVKDFAAKIKEKYPEYNSVADDVLVNKMIEKYPVYKDQVDISQKKNLGHTSKTGAEESSDSIPTVQLESKSQLEKTPDWEENPLNPLAAVNKAQAKKEEAQKIMPQPTPTIGKKVVAKVTPTKVTPQRKPIAQLPEQDEEDDGFFAKAREKLLGIMFPTLGAAAQVVSSIPNAKDYLKYTWNKTLESVGRVASGTGELFIDALSMGSDPNIPKEELLKTYRNVVAPKIRQAPQKYVGASVPEDKMKDFDDSFVASTIAGLPSIMVEAAVPFGGAFIADAIDTGIQTINSTEEGRKLPESQKTIFGLGAGLAMGGLTALGIDKILGKQTSKVANNLAVKTFVDLMAKNEGKAITKEMFESAIQENSKSLYNKLISTGGKLAESSLVGGLFSAGVETANEVSKQIANKLTKKQVFDPFSWGTFGGNTFGAFGHGAAAGFALGATTIPFIQAENGIKNEVLKARTPQDIEALKTQVVEQVSQGSLDPIHAESIVNIIDSYNAANTKVPVDVPNREEKVELVKQKDDLKQAATNKLNETKTVDDAFHPQIQQEATALLNRANELNQEITGQPSEPAKHSMYADPLELPELKEQITDIQRRIDLGGADGEKAKLELTEIKTDPAKFYESRKEEAKNNLTDKTSLNKALETYDNIINKIKQYDKENESGLSGSVGVGEKPIEAQPIEGRGAQEIGGGRDIQAQGIEGEGKGVEGKVGEEVEPGQDMWKMTQEESFKKYEDKDTQEGLLTHEQMADKFLGSYNKGESGISIEGNSVVYRDANGDPKGFAHFDKDGIREIGVDKPERGKGISSKMLDYLKKEKGIDKILPPFSKEGNAISHRNEVKKAIREQKYDKAIGKGEMTAQDAKSIIESAGLEVPKTIEDLIVGEKKTELPEQKEAPKEEVKAEPPKQTEEVKVEAEAPEQKTILTLKTDLKGDKKQSWMLEATEKEVEQAKLKDTPRGSQFYPKKISDIERAIEKYKYEKAIEDGRMTAQDAKSIIESAGLEVPKSIEDLIVEEKKAELPKQKEQPKRKASDGAILNRVDAKKVYQEVWKTDEPVDAIGAAQRWLATGGKVNRDSFSEQVTGYTKSRGAAKTSISTDAIRNEFTGVEKDLPTINKAAHDIWESLPEHIQDNVTDQDIRNALIDQLQQYNKRIDLAKDYLKNYSPESAIENYYKDIEERENVAFEKEMKELNEWMQQTGEEEGKLRLEEDYINNLIKQYEEESRNEPRPIETEDKGVAKGEATRAAEEVSSTKDIRQEEPTKPTKPTEPKPADVEPPVPPTISKQGTLEGGEDALKGITMADNAKRREELGMPERKPNPETVEEWTAEAKRQIADGYNINDLIEKMERGEQNSDVENVIARIFRTTLDVEVRKNPSNENIAASERLIKAIESSSSKIGKALRSLQGLSNPFENISDFYVAKKEANKVDNLTDAQKAEVQKDFENIQKAKDEYEKKWKEAEAKFAEMQAQNELLRQQKEKEGKKYTKEGKRDFVAERKDLKEQLKNEIQKYKNNTQKLGISSNGGASDFAITVEMAKIIGKIAKSHVEEVGAKLSDVTQRTFDDVKDLFDGITTKDIHDVIAGKYSERKETKSELLSNLRQIQSEAKLLNELDRVLAGEPKNEKQKIERNQKLADLRRQINDVKKSGGLEEYSNEAKAKKSIEANKRKEEKIKERLANNDFDPETKRESIYDSKEFKSKNPKLYKELLDSQVKKQEAELEFHKKLVENEMANMGKVDKFKQIITKARGTLKAIYAGIDDSAVGVQNWFQAIVNPSIGARAVKDHVLDFWSQKRFDRNIEELHNSSDWNMMKESGLQVSEPKSLLEAGKEEMFPDRFKAIIKVKGKEYGWINIGGKKYEIFDVLKPFERAFTSLGNSLRVIKFRTEAEKMYEKGITFENNPEEFKKLATRINAMTSASKPNEAFKSDIVNMAIWSPRLMASKLNILGISDLASYTPLVKNGYYRSLGEKGKILSKQQLYAAKDLAKFATAVVAGSYLFASARGGQLNTNPEDDRFMNVELPNGKTYNFTGGFSKYISTLYQIARGGKINRMTGEFEKYKGFKDRGSEILHFLRGKMPPISGSIVSVATKKDYLGKPANLYTEAEKYKMPMAVSQIYDQVEKDGYGSLFGQGIPTFLGINVGDKRNYMETGLFTKEDVSRPELKTLTDKGISIPRLSVKETYKVKRDEAHPEGVMTDDEYKDLAVKVHDYMINGWEDEDDNMENGINGILNANYNVQTYTETDEEEPSKEEVVLGKDLPAEQLKNKLSSLKDKAVKKAIEDMGLTKKSKIVVKEEE